MPRKKGSPAKKRPTKTIKTKAKAPAEDEAPQDSQAQVTVPITCGKFHLWYQSSANWRHWASVSGGESISRAYSWTMASQTSRTTRLMVLWGTLQAYCI